MLASIFTTMFVSGVPVSHFNNNRELENHKFCYSYKEPIANTTNPANITVIDFTGSVDSFRNKYTISDINYTTGDIVGESLAFNSLKYGEIDLSLKKEISVKFFADEDGYYTDDELFELYCYGKTLEELQKEVCEALVVSWKLYMDCDIDELSDDAKELRKTLEEYIERG